MILFFIYFELVILAISAIVFVIKISQFHENYTSYDLREVLTEFIRHQSESKNPQIWELITEPEISEIEVIDFRQNKQILIPPELLHSHELRTYWDLLLSFKKNRPSLLLQLLLILFFIEYFTSLITYNILDFLIYGFIFIQVWLVISRFISLTRGVNKIFIGIKKDDLAKIRLLVFTDSLFLARHIFFLPVKIFNFLRP